MKHTHTTTRRQRRDRGAAMVESVMVMPFIVMVIMLVVYLGWNFRRLALVTNMDRYTVWKAAMPGAPGPYRGGVDNPQLNNAFFQINSDEAIRLDERYHNVGYLPRGHHELREQQADETYSYLDAFLEDSPRGRQQQFTATHNQQMNTGALGLSDLTRNGLGHSRLDGEWRYANGIRYSGSEGKWVPSGYRVSPGTPLREVFFSDLDEGLAPYENNGSELAGVIREFYTFYPGYRGPDLPPADSGIGAPGF